MKNSNNNNTENMPDMDMQDQEASLAGSKSSKNRKGGTDMNDGRFSNIRGKMVPQSKFKKVLLMSIIFFVAFVVSFSLNIFEWVEDVSEVQDEDSTVAPVPTVNPAPPPLQPSPTPEKPSDEETGDSGDNEEETTEPEEPAINTLGIPSDVNGQSNASSVTLQWDEVEDATHYDIAYCGGDVECTGSLHPIRNIPDTSYTLKNLESTTRYSFRIIAKNESAISEDWSEYITVKTKSTDTSRSGGGGGGDDSDNTQSVSPGQYPTPTVSAYLTVDTNTEYYDGDANNVATNIIPYDSYLIINSNVPATVSNPNDDPNDPNDDEVANPNNPVRYDISVCFREVTSSSWECKDYATNVATLGTDPNSNDYSLRYEIYDINDSDDKDALDHFFGDLYDDGTEIDPKVKCGKGYSFRFTAKTIANTIEDDETLTKDSNTSSSALANINTPACTTQGG